MPAENPFSPAPVMMTAHGPRFFAFFDRVHGVKKFFPDTQVDGVHRRAIQNDGGYEIFC